MTDSQKRFKLLGDAAPHVIGKGSFGQVFLGLDRHTKRLVAVKSEKQSEKHQLLQHEYKILKRSTAPMIQLGKIAPALAKGIGLTRGLGYWEADNMCYLATTLLGPDVNSLHKLCGTFSLKTILMFTKKALELLEYYHSKHIVHCDIKPANFLVDYKIPHKKLYLIDFGLSQMAQTQRASAPLKRGRVGTLRFMSPNIHKFATPSPVDDLYSLGYCIIHLFTGHLPWKGNYPNLSRQERLDHVGKIKQRITPQELTANCKCYSCRQAGTPCSFQRNLESYFMYLEDLSRSGSVVRASEIDYTSLVNGIVQCFVQHKLQCDLVWDWNKYYIIPTDQS